MTDTMTDSTAIRLEPAATLDDVYELGGMNWDLVALPLFRPTDSGGYHLAGQKRALVRSDTGTTLGIVSPSYQPYSPIDARPLLAAIQRLHPDGCFDSVWMLAGGQHVVLQYRIRSWSVGDGDGDRSHDYLNVHLGSDGSTSVRIYASSTRLACENQVQWGWRNGGRIAAIPHTITMNAMEGRLIRALDSARQASREWEALATRLIQHPLDEARRWDLVRRLAEAITRATSAADDTEKARRRTWLVHDRLLGDDTYGAAPDTAWDFVNRATGYVQHEQRRRDRVRSAVMPPPSEQAQKARIIEVARELVGGAA